MPNRRTRRASIRVFAIESGPSPFSVMSSPFAPRFVVRLQAQFEPHAPGGWADPARLYETFIKFFSKLVGRIQRTSRCVWAG